MYRRMGVGGTPVRGDRKEATMTTLNVLETPAMPKRHEPPVPGYFRDLARHQRDPVLVIQRNPLAAALKTVGGA